MHVLTITETVALATWAGVSNAVINQVCLAYTVSRLAYGYAYIKLTSDKDSRWRTLIWWCCNLSCFTGLIAAWRAQ